MQRDAIHVNNIGLKACTVNTISVAIIIIQFKMRSIQRGLPYFDEFIDFKNESSCWP